jgi:hypothetical protein
MGQTRIASAGRVDVWLELESHSAAWEERLSGALVLRGTRGVEHVALAEVRLASPPIALQGGAAFALELDSTRWEDFYLGAEETTRIPFYLTVPWGVGFDAEAELAGKVVIRDGLSAGVSVRVRFLPPETCVQAAEALARVTGLAVQHWTLDAEEEAVVAQLGRPKGTASELKAAELRQYFDERGLHCRLSVEWPAARLPAFRAGSGSDHASYRFRLPAGAAEEVETFFRRELLPWLLRRQSGSFPIPTEGGMVHEEQLPRIPSEPPVDPSS